MKFEKRFYVQLCGPVILDLYAQNNENKNPPVKNWLNSYLRNVLLVKFMFRKEVDVDQRFKERISCKNQQKFDILL
jgi:hypothetical protein